MSVIDAIAAMRALGYDHDFSVTADAQLRCGTCGSAHAPSDAVVERTRRFEGMSDPGDAAAIFGLRCRGCDARGVLVTAYGPTASAQEASVLRQLHDPGD